MKDNNPPLMAPKIDPLTVQVGQTVRARNFKRSVSVVGITEDRRKVQLKDYGKPFWIDMTELVSFYA